MDTDKVVSKLKQSFEENPLQVIGIGSMALMAVTKFFNAATWRREVRRREFNAGRRRR